MKLSELILFVGDDNVMIQNLDEAGISLDYNIKKGTRITFGTEMALTPTGTERLGLVIWIDRARAKAALGEIRAPQPKSPSK